VATARFRIIERDIISWRLLATNNRDLGRAPQGYPDAETCRAAIGRLRDQVGQAEPVTVRRGPTSWGWRLMVGDQVVAVASREYQRRIQAEQAAAVVLGLIPAADLTGFDRS
jgi:hypothetical protein